MINISLVRVFKEKSTLSGKIIPSSSIIQDNVIKSIY